MFREANCAKEMLKMWKNKYTQIRREIEISLKGNRWEFSEALLFRKSEYIANICQDVSNIVQVLSLFINYINIGDLTFATLQNSTKSTILFLGSHRNRKYPW